MKWSLTFLMAAAWTGLGVSLQEDLSAPFEADTDNFVFSQEPPENLAKFVSGANDWGLVSENHRSLQLTDDCVEDGPYFYDLGISITPGSTQNDVCKRPQQIMLGHEINLLLIRIGLGERSDGDNILAMGNVCSEPVGSTTTSSSRRALRSTNRRLGFGFVYRGGFACGWFCAPDDSDDRRLEQRDGRELVNHNCNDPNNWLQCYISQVSSTLEAEIRASIAPRYPGCMGTNPTVDVTMTQKPYAELEKLGCTDKVDDVDYLESFSLADFHISTDSHVTCGSCSALTFAQKGDGSGIHESYIDQDTWMESHGITVSARAAYGGGYTPGNKPRAFNSTKWNSVAADLRSPNESCGGGGPGKGLAGRDGLDGENCEKLGNVLIVQGSNKNEPDPNAAGGIITFEFASPVLLSDIGIIDADDTEHRLRFEFSDGTHKTFTYNGFGDNGVQRVICNMKQVVLLEVQFRETAGITELNYCEQCTTAHDSNGGTSKLVAMEDFEDTTPLSNWYNGKIETNGGGDFSTFLGRFKSWDADPYKTYIVPPDASSLTVTFDLLQIDSWEQSSERGADSASIYVGSEAIHLGVLRDRYDQESFRGMGTGNLIFDAKKLKEGNLGFAWYENWHFDVIWRITMEIPGGQDSAYANGALQLRFHAGIPRRATDDESMGIDNIRIVANHACNWKKDLYFEDFEGSSVQAMDKWNRSQHDDTAQAIFTKFLGRYMAGMEAAWKYWQVPTNADSISISLDFYQIDNWAYTDFITIWIDDEEVNIGRLRLRGVGEEIGGQTTNGVNWQCRMTAEGQMGYDSNWVDQKYRISLDVPPSMFQDGYVTLTLYAYLQDTGGSAGWDNIDISANYGC